MRKIIDTHTLFGFIILSILLSNSLSGQIRPFEVKLIDEFEAMYEGTVEERYDSLGPKFKTSMEQVLTQEVPSMDYPFDSLGKKMKIITSKDQKLRVFSWDELTGGTWHQLDAFAQYVDNHGNIHFRQLDTDKEFTEGGHTDVIIYEIHQLLINGLWHYLTLGWGTHGSGHHHAIVQIFRINGQQLIKCENCIDGNPELVVIGPRSEKLALFYDPENELIIHNTFVLNDDFFGYK